jgi:DNA-damage-inducible protein D
MPQLAVRTPTLFDAIQDVAEIADPDITSPFDTVKRVENGREVWYARDLMKLMGYPSWPKFQPAIRRMRNDLTENGFKLREHITRVSHMSPLGNGGVRRVPDLKLSLKAAHLLALNCLTHEGAKARNYFSNLTRFAEVSIREAAKRAKRFRREGRPEGWIAQREKGVKVRKGYTSTLLAAGVTNPAGFKLFTNAMYAVFQGADAPEIRQQLQLPPRAVVRDHVGECPLAEIEFAERIAVERIRALGITDQAECLAVVKQVAVDVRQLTSKHLTPPPGPTLC